MRGPWFVVVYWLIALATLCSPCLASEFREQGAHWKLSNIDGWESMSSESLKLANKASKAAVGAGSGNWSYTSGFKPTGKEDLTYPYVLVQTTPIDFQGTSYADLDKAFASVPAEMPQRLNGDWADVLSNPHMDRPILDRATGRTYMKVQMDVKGVGQIQGYCVGFLGNDGMITLNYYAKTDEFAKGLPAFQTLVDAFSYDNGFAFTPSSRGFSWSSVLGKGLIGAICGGVIAGVAGLGRWLRQRSNAATG